MDHVASAKDGGLFQSALWREFQHSLGKETVETEVFLGTLHQAPILGQYLEVSRGPLQTSFPPQELKQIFQQVAHTKKLSLIRIEPQYDSLLEDIKKTGLRFRKAPLDAQPREIFQMSLEESEETLFANLKSKTRYNIRLAQKKGVVVRPVATEAEKEQFLDILAATARRKNIAFHSRNYYQQFIEFFVQEKGMTFVAVQNGQVLAGSILVFFGSTAYYMHGGSSDVGRNLMAPHLLQWEQIRLAKKRGCTRYDFGGAAVQRKEKEKDWSGITRFKQGFAPGTKTILFPGTYDLVFSPVKYFSYLFATRLKKFF